MKMQFHWRAAIVLALTFTCAILAACGPGGREEAGETAAPPEESLEVAAESPKSAQAAGDIVFKFEGFVPREGEEGRDAKFGITNTYSRGVKKIVMLLAYKDENGDTIKTAGSSVATSTTLLKPQESIERILGHNVPEEAVTVEVHELRDVVWDDEEVQDFTSQE